MGYWSQSEIMVVGGGSSSNSVMEEEKKKVRRKWGIYLPGVYLTMLLVRLYSVEWLKNNK